MKKGIIKKVVIIVVSLIVIAVLMHLTMNYLIPFIQKMHSKGNTY